MKKVLIIIGECFLLLTFFATVVFAAGNGAVDSTVEINSSTTNGPSLIDNDAFGAAVASLGDLDGDGIVDIAIGAPGDDEGGTGRGAVHIFFLNADGSVKSTVEINSSTTNGPTLTNGDNLGWALENIGDLNGDGVVDIAVGAPFDDEGGVSRGALHIFFLNSDGSVDLTVEINSSTANGPSLANGDGFGREIANIGDLNGDGVTDIAVGAPTDDAGGSSRGAVHIIFLNTDGSVDSTVEINNNTTNGPSLTNGDNFGISIANIGDLDGDGVTDIVVGATGDDEGGSSRGAVHIFFLNADGSVKSTVEINSSTTNGPILEDLASFGISVAPLSDFDGDGIVDIAVGAPTNTFEGAYLGSVHIISLDTDGSVKSTAEINGGTENLPTLVALARFGEAVESIGDLDGNGVIDLLVGARLVGVGGTGRGGAYILFMHNAPPASVAEAAPSGNGIPFGWLDPPKGPFAIHSKNGTKLNTPWVDLVLDVGSNIRNVVFATNTDNFSTAALRSFTKEYHYPLCSRLSGLLIEEDCPEGTYTIYAQFFTEFNQPSPIISTTVTYEITSVNNTASSFTKNLYRGVSDPEVLQLQILLNEQGFLVATEGAGSPGNETSYFGRLTENALKKFQKAHFIEPPFGYFGPITRSVISVL